MKSLISVCVAVLLALIISSIRAAPPTDVEFKDIEVGTGASLKRNAFAVMHFSAWVYDETAAEFKGSQFGDSRARGETVTWVYGLRRAIAGVEKGMAGMRVGGKRYVLIPAKLGYDGHKHAAPAGVPPNSTLVFEIDLLSVVPQGAPE
ncbi:MAG: FKBP-type peptidyl-prolyl cis-trans isomerase [Betaproteobacteria bacterium]|nr:FKBP-type peptidyl-prolyl cis-trans isomerase [Betaproteobacteria bacterium]